MQTTCWTVTLQAGVAFRTLPSGILICTWCKSVFAHTKNTTRTNNSKVYYLSGANFWFDVITEALFFLFQKKLEDISPFCGATDTPVLDFWWHPAWVGPFACMLCCLCFMDSSDSPLVNTCWLLGNQHDSWAIFNPSPQYLYMWQCDQRQIESLATLKTRTKACSSYRITSTITKKDW